MQYTRNYNFTTGTTIVADQIDQEFDSVKGVINGNIDTDNLADVSVTEEKIATNAVTTDKIEDDAVTMPKISNPYAFCAAKTSIQNIGDASWTDVTWTELADYNNNFDGTSYTAPIDGLYHFDASFITRHSLGGGVYMIGQLLRSDGKQFAYQDHVCGTGHNEFGVSMSASIPLTAGQSVKAQAYVDHSAGGQADVYGGTAYASSFSGFLVRN